jgi:ParB family chromosome partitioning protein
VFARLLALPDEVVLKVLALVMRRWSLVLPWSRRRASFSSQTWVGGGQPMTPSLDLVRDRTAVNALIAEVAGNAIADANVSEMAKVEKKIVRDPAKRQGLGSY